MRGWESVIRRETVAKILDELFRAAEAMLAQTWPRTPDPEPVFFEIAPNMIWPAVTPGGTVLWTHHYTEKSTTRVYTLNSGSFDWGSPQEALDSILKLREATRWCLDQAQKRRQLAETILEEQSSAVNELRLIDSAIRLGE